MRRTAWLVTLVVAAAMVFALPRLPERADRAWDAHDPPLRCVTLHECRHTYASYLMAAGYTLREIMEYSVSLGNSRREDALRAIEEEGAKRRFRRG